MAGGATSGSLRRCATFAALLAACLPGWAQERITLTELAARKPADSSPAYEGRRVIIRGTVSAGAHKFPTYNLLGIQDEAGGAVLQVDGKDTRLDGLKRGAEIEAEGIVGNLAGLPAVKAERIVTVGAHDPPVAEDVPLSDLLKYPENLKYIGRLVRTHGPVVDTGDTTAGGQVLIGSEESLFKIFIPRPLTRGAPPLERFQKNSTVSATGVMIQYCPRPPYDRWFELLVAGPDEIVVTAQPPFVPPVALATAMGIVLLIAFFLWSRERRLRKQRERLRKTYQLGEEILGASSVDAMVTRIAEMLPGIVGVSRVRVYLYNRASKTLDAAVLDGGGHISIPISATPGGTQAGAVACFHYRTLLVIPDATRSPFPIVGHEEGATPKSLLFVPMMAQGEVMGVLELDQNDRARAFPPDEQALAQHLGNQIGVAVRLLDQRSVREQLFRTEKLAAVGRLISGVVNELETPLASISELARKAMLAVQGGAAERNIAAIAAEAQKAAGMVARLVSYAGNEMVELRPVSVTSLLQSLIAFREGDWKASGIRISNLAAREPFYVLGSQGQLEQVFLNLLVHAEQSLADAPQKSISIRTSVLARRLLVEISFTAPPESRKPEEAAAVLGVTRSVLAGHNGEVRLIEKPNEVPRFEVDLPAAAKDGEPAEAASARRDPSRTLTAIVIEPDDAAQRLLLSLLSVRGCRVVPVGNSDTALDLSHRLRFDVAFCSVHAPGLNWVELSERMQTRVGGFVLLSDRYDPELSADFEGENRFVLPKPVQEPELDRVLAAVERGALAQGR